MNAKRMWRNWAWTAAVVLATANFAPAQPTSIQDAPILTPAAPATPRINGPRVYGARPGRPFLYRIPTTGDRPLKFAAADLPAGLSLDADKGIISGTTPADGTYAVKLSATNAKGANTAVLRIVAGDTISLTPAMGWNSWNCWAESVDQDKIEKAAAAIVRTGLADHGWTYVNIDDAWQGVRSGPNTPIGADAKKFPDMAGLTARLHAEGLKAGIYSTPWTATYAGRIGSSATQPSGQFTPPQPRDNRKTKKLPFALGPVSFAAADANQFAAWGIDYLKYDWAPIDVPSTKTMADALRDSGRDIVLSLSNNGDGAVMGRVIALGEYAQSWRTTDDINDSWKSVKFIGFEQTKWAGVAGPGHWNDADMLVVGQVGWGPRLHPTRLTPDEQYTHISLWCLLASPLLIGCDLEKLDPFTLGLLTNDEVLAIDQDELGLSGACVAKRGDVQVWRKPLADGSIAVGLFNLGDAEATARVTGAEVGLAGAVAVRDLWRQKELGRFAGAFESKVASHGVRLIRLSRSAD